MIFEASSIVYRYRDDPATSAAGTTIERGRDPIGETQPTRGEEDCSGEAANASATVPAAAAARGGSGVSAALVA